MADPTIAPIAPDAVERGRRALLRTVRDVPDFPTQGVLFKDITPTLADPRALADVLEAMAALVADAEVDALVGVESRGFVLAAPLALRLGVGLVLVRKAGKLPPPVSAVTYSLEYGTARLELADGTVRPGSKVAIIDDVLATGGTLAAAATLLRDADVEVARLAVLMEIAGLAGSALAGLDVRHLITV